MKGIVYKSTGNLYLVKTDSNEVYKCTIKGKFRSLGIKSTNPIAVGDQVYFEIINKENFTGVIFKIEKRKNYIIRKSVKLSKFSHIIASNIDCCFLFVTPRNPLTSSIFIDRILVATKSFGIETVILFNKTDIYSKNDIKYINNLRNIYSKIGYKCVDVSVLKEINIDKIIEIMKHKISIFTGHSGVGKSSLLNLLDPALNIRTAKVSKQNEQGKHTTTYAELFDIDFGARVIDTPGIKGFGIVNFEKNEIGDFFPEFFQNKNKCKFNNCLHIDEPDCFIKELVSSNKINISRYENYKQIIMQDDLKYRQ